MSEPVAAALPDGPISLDPAPDAPSTLAGAWHRRVVPAPIKLIQIFCGYLLVRWLVVVAGRYLAGLGTETELAWDGARLRMRSVTRLLGREVRRTDETFLAGNLVSVGVERRFPQLLLLLGALGVLLGAIYGLGWVIDGVQASYLPLAMFGLGVLTAGVLLDIGLGTLFGHLGGRTSLLVSIRSGARFSLLGRRFRVVGVDEEAARAFVERVAHG